MQTILLGNFEKDSQDYLLQQIHEKNAITLPNITHMCYTQMSSRKELKSLEMIPKKPWLRYIDK